jgi:anti-sigma factor ChrR (cupin superfamily)
MTEHLPPSILSGLHPLGVGTRAARHLRDCADCSEKLRATESRITEIVGLAAEEQPPASLRDRVLASASQAPRLVRFTDVVAQLLDVTPDKAREFLAAVDQPELWETTPFEGVTRMPVEGGPRTEGAVAHFVRVEPGKIVPMHEHIGPEVGVFLQGYGQGDDGQMVSPGELDERATGTAHSVAGLPGVASVMLVVAHGGVRFGDFEILPPARSSL